MKPAPLRVFATAIGFAFSAAAMAGGADDKAAMTGCEALPDGAPGTCTGKARDVALSPGAKATREKIARARALARQQVADARRDMAEYKRHVAYDLIQLK